MRIGAGWFRPFCDELFLLEQGRKTCTGISSCCCKMGVRLPTHTRVPQRRPGCPTQALPLRPPLCARRPA